MSGEKISNTNHRPINILLADDGSPHARAAIDFILDLPLPKGSKVTALGVLIPLDSSNHSVLEMVLEKTRNLLEENGIHTETEMILGYPQEIIVEYVEKNKPDLIVLGAKGLRATFGILLGGVAQQVVEYSCCPVLIIRAPYEGFKRIAIVIDSSPYSELAVEYLTGKYTIDENIYYHKFPLPKDVDIRVIHVLPPMPSTDMITQTWPMGSEMLPLFDLSKEDKEEWMRQHKPKGQKLLNQAIDELKKGNIEAKGELLMGDAATEILNYAAENNIDLLIAGSRGLSRLKSLLLGSVSRKLVHYAKCSVLIVKAETKEHL